MLLQVPEQREAVEAEIQAHSMVQHRNVLQLICSEIQGNVDGSSTAFLLFPYYRVSNSSTHDTGGTTVYLTVGWYSTRSHGTVRQKWAGIP